LASNFLSEFLISVLFFARKYTPIDANEYGIKKTVDCDLGVEAWLFLGTQALRRAALKSESRIPESRKKSENRIRKDNPVCQ